MKSDKISISVRSALLGKKWYTISRFLDYDVTIDMDTDTDSFSFTFPNTDSIFTGLVSGYDRANIKINGVGIMQGIVESVGYSYSDSSSSITISGRDKVCLLTDNDVVPDSKKNVKPTSYVSSLCKKHGIKYKPKKNIGTVKKFELDIGESELSTIDKILERSGQTYWFIYDTLYTGSWNVGGKSKYRFTRGLTKNTGILIKELELVEDYSDVRSSIKLYGSSDDGKSKYVGSSSLPIVKKRGFTKVSVESCDEDTSATKLKSDALKRLKEEFRDAIVVKIRIYNNGHVILPNNVCTIVDKYTGINSTMYIRAVRYYKSVDDGSMSEITCIPSQATLNKLLNTNNVMHSLVNTTKTSLNQKLASVLNKYSKKW